MQKYATLNILRVAAPLKHGLPHIHRLIPHLRAPDIPKPLLVMDHGEVDAVGEPRGCDLRAGRAQGNRVKKSRSEEAYEKFVTPSGDFAP